MCDGGQFLHVFNVGAADVGVEEHRVAMAVLPLHEMFEVFAHMLKGFGKPRLFFNRIHGEVDRSYAGVGETVCDFRTQKPSVRREVHPEIFLRRVVNNLVNEVWPDQRFTAGGGKHAARRRLQPVDRAPRGVFRHALDAVVIGPAVVAVQIAFPFGEEVRDDRLKVARQDS